MNQEMEAKKEYLKGYESDMRKLKRCEERIRELRCNRMGAAINLDGMPHAHNNTDLSSYAAALDAEEKYYLNIILASMERSKKIQDTIEQLSNEDEKDVLTYRYITLLKWEEICTKMSKSWRQVHRLHSSGLQNIKIKFDLGQQA